MNEEYKIMKDYLDYLDSIGAINIDHDHYGAAMDCFPRKSKGYSEKDCKMLVLDILLGGDGMSKFAYNKLISEL